MAPVEESLAPESVPAQWRPQTLYDFRGMPDGPRGYKVGVTKKGRVGSKRKLDEYSKQVRIRHDMACTTVSSLQQRTDIV
jgi:hypothetical protein